MAEIAAEKRYQHSPNGAHLEKEEEPAVVQRKRPIFWTDNGVFPAAPVQKTQRPKRAPQGRDPHPNESQHPKASVFDGVIQKVVVNLPGQCFFTQDFSFQLTLISRMDHFEVPGTDTGEDFIVCRSDSTAHAFESENHRRNAIGLMVTIHIRPSDQRGDSASNRIFH